MTTAREAIEQLTNPKPDDTSQQLTILAQLPADLPAPGMTSLTAEPDGSTACGWLSWSTRAQDGVEPVEILRVLEGAGWSLSPATLTKWDKWRAHPMPGHIEDQPETEPGCFGRSYTLTDAWEMMPVWVAHSYFGRHQSLHCYMTAPDGMTYKVAVEGSFNAGTMTATRREYRGGWEYERGSARLNTSVAVFALRNSEGEDIAHIAATSYCCLGGGWPHQSLDGRTYWEPIVNREQWADLTASSLVQQLQR
jgi:hypothetical protein